jgi:hypothetical protein
VKVRPVVLGLLAAAALMPVRPADAAVPGPVAAYGFEEASGTTTADATGAGRTGTVAGAT